MKKIKIQPNFYEDEINDFLNETTFIFTSKNKKIKNFILDLSKLKNISILGMLVIYKFISYTAKNSVFASPTLQWDARVRKIFDQYGFTKLLDKFINYSTKTKQNVNEFYNSLIGSETKTLFCSPHCMLRNDLQNSISLEQSFLNKIREFYDATKGETVNLITSELMLNFWTHATVDTDSIIVAKGGINYFSLYLIDNGDGILTTLKQNVSYINVPDPVLLEQAFNPGITSKPNTNHHGSGLYLVRELVKLNKGELHLYTEGYQYRIKDGKIKVIQAPYWHGAILELKIKLNKIKDVTNVKQPDFKHKIRRYN